LLDAPQWPSESPQGNRLLFFASLKTLLISTKAKCLTPKSTSRASFSLAGFQVTLIGRFWVTPEVEKVRKMAAQLCQKCKQSHPGRVCHYDEKPECAETITVNEVAQPGNEPSKDEED
jgi:hypothetical protein